MSSIHTGACVDRHCDRESARGRGTLEERSTIIFGYVRVQTVADYVAGEYRESARGRGTLEERSTIIFGYVGVQTVANCVAGECFIHCAMPLGPLTEKINLKSLMKKYRKASFDRR